MKMSEIGRRFWPVAVGATLGLTAALVVGAMIPRSYEATTTLFLGSPASTDSSGAYSGDMFSQQRASTYAELVGSRDLAVKVIDDLGLEATPDELAATVRGAPVPRTVLMRITVTDSSAQQACDVANAYATDFITYVGRLETPIGSSQPSSAVTVVQRAEVPIATAASSSALYGLVGLLIGATLGLFATWARRKLDRTARTPEHVENATGLTVLGVLPKCSAAAYLSAIYKLRTNLMFADVDSPATAIAMVTPSSGMSTAVTVTHLGTAFAGIGRKVALVDADLRESRLTRYLGTETEVGLASVISRAVPLDEALVRMTEFGVDLLPAGRSTMVSSDVLASDGMAKLLAELRTGHDVVLCDTPGLLDATDGSIVGLGCDGVVLVAVYGKSRVDNLHEAAETLRRLGVRLLGAVLSEAR
jgi:succinoglycan biosynthesis transport protein ExoP